MNSQWQGPHSNLKVQGLTCEGSEQRGSRGLPLEKDFQTPENTFCDAASILPTYQCSHLKLMIKLQVHIIFTSLHELLSVQTKAELSLKGEVQSKIKISNLAYFEVEESQTNVYLRFYAVILPLFASKPCFLTAAILPDKKTGASVAV